jgi:hypothetical protein
VTYLFVLTYFAVIYGLAFATATHALRHITQKVRRATAQRLAELEGHHVA